MSAYDFDGEKYKKASSHQEEWGKKLISKLNLKGDERILDLGCGDGRLTTMLSELVPGGSVLGIDSSLNMIKTAKKNQRENLDFYVGDIDEIDYECEFDVIFSNAALHWVKDHNKLLANCNKALKKGGIIRFSFGGSGNCMNLNDSIKHAMELPCFEKHFSGFEWPWYMPDVAEYSGLIEGDSYGKVIIWEENADRYFEDQHQMIGWVDQPCLVPFISYIPDEVKVQFREAVIKNIIERTLQDNGTCFETFRRINVKASKV